MRDAGFHPHPVIHSATSMGTETPVMDDDIGTLQCEARAGTTYTLTL